MKIRSLYNTMALLLIAYLFLASSSGRTGNWAGAPGDNGTCATCHNGSPGGGGSITLTGVPTEYSPNQVIPLTLTLSDNAAVRGGFQIIATSGTNNTMVGSFTPSAGTKLVNSNTRLVQSTPQAFSGGSVSWTFDWVAPAAGSATPQVQFFFAGNAAVDGGGLDNDNGYNSSSAAFILPVELTYFSANIDKNEHVQLDWQTASEINSDYFEIERSYENTANKFEIIGRVAAAGETYSRTDYAFLDENPAANQTIYYRLKQVDFDGKTSYSTIQSVKMEEATLSLFPNPMRAGETLSFDYQGEENSILQVQISNLAGQIVYEDLLEFQTGKNTFAQLFPQLTNGIFTVAVFDNHKMVAMEKLVVNN